MQNNRAMSMMAGGTLGIIGTMALFTWKEAPFVGFILLLVAVGLVFYPKIQERTGRAPVRKTPTREMVIENHEQNQREMMELVADPHPPVPGRVKGEISVLIRTLRQATLDPHVPVLEDDGGPLLFIQDVLEEMLVQAKRRDMTVNDLANNAVTLYDRVFENTEAACRASKSVDAVCIWLANRCLKDVFPKLEGKQDIKPANKPGGIDRFAGHFDEMQ
jgi:hypothetical protein